MRILFYAAVIAASVSTSYFSARAHEGHDHGAPPPQVYTSAAPRTEAVSDEHELVAIARAGVITIYLDRFGTNEPVTGAAIEVETPAGAATAIAAGDAYRMNAPWSERPGSYDLIFTVTGKGEADVMTASLVIPAAATSAPAHSALSRAATELRQRLTRGDPAVLGASGLGLLTGAALIMLMRARRGAATAAALLLLGAIALYGTGALAQGAAPSGEHSGQTALARDLSQRLPDGSVFVPKPAQRLLALRTVAGKSSTHARTLELPGRIIADPNGSGYVQAAVSGRLSPPPGGFPRLGAIVKEGDTLAFVTPPLTAAETSDQRQRQGELDQQISILQRRLARSQQLANNGVISRVQLDETQLELQGLQDRRAALDSQRRQPEALTAPVSGVIASVNAVAGQIAETNAIVFQIIDPQRLWIEALSFEAPGNVTAATARTASMRSITLQFKGSGLSDRTQAIPVQFQITGDASGLHIGQLLSVYIQTNESTAGIAVPRTSVLTGPNGQSIVYEHTSAERFEPREVRAIPLDANRVLIAAGLAAGGRIVTQGAELLNQVR